MRNNIFDIDNRDKTMIVKQCHTCDNLTIIEKDWLRFITKIGEKIRCVACIFPEWSFLRSPMRVFTCSKCGKVESRSDRCSVCKQDNREVSEK